MFQHIMAPVDLGHLDKLRRALDTAADLAKHYGADLTYVSITAATPGKLAHNPEEFAAKLKSFSKEESDRHGVTAKAHPVTTHDPTTDVDDALLQAIEDVSADLVVMASHKPSFADYFWHSNGGELATQSGVSVMLVRDA